MPQPMAVLVLQLSDRLITSCTSCHPLPDHEVRKEKWWPQR